MTNRSLDFSPAGPVARAFMADNSFVRLLVGPLGSGKTSAAVVELLRRAQMQAPGPDGVRRVRFACIRNTFSELKSTTIKSWQQWCPLEYGKMTLGTSPIVHLIETNDLSIEALFVPLDKPEDVRKLLSLELSFAWIDECREVPKEVLDALTGRVGRYPSRMQGGCTWSGVLLTSNPSDTESWVYKLATDPPEGYAVFRQPSGRSESPENIANLPDAYYDRIAAGKDPEWVKVFIDGEFGFVIEGRPVYPSWRDSVHVPAQKIEASRALGLKIGCDWGLSPAAVIVQQHANGQIAVLDEITCEDTNIVQFAELLSRYVREHYPDCQVTSAVGDPAGTSRGPDGTTVFEIMNQFTPWRWREAPGGNEITLRIEVVSAALNRMINGKPGLLVNPNCGMLRKGFAGGYHHQRVSAGAGFTFQEKPRKNQYSHVHDSLQYALLSCGGSDAVLNRDPNRRNNRPRFADGLDYDPIYNQETDTKAPRVVWGSGRPAHLDRGARPRSFMATNTENPFE
jgi:hypothetical protein